MMRAKRRRDRKAIASFQQGRHVRQEGPADPVPQKEPPQKEEEDEDMADSVQVWAAGAAGAEGETARSQQPLGQTVVQPHAPISCLWKWGTASAYSLQERGVETKAGEQPQGQS